MLALTFLLVPEISWGYSGFTHEAVIDSAWECLLSRVPAIRAASSAGRQISCVP